MLRRTVYRRLNRRNGKASNLTFERSQWQRFDPLSANPTKWSTNCLSVLDHFAALALKGLKSHLFKHSVETNHKTVTLDDFKIIGKGYKRSKIRHKLAESLHIKEKRSSLNTVIFLISCGL